MRAEPQISRFIFQDAPDMVIGQPLRCSIVGNEFPSVFAHSPSIRAEPEISRFIFQDDSGYRYRPVPRL